MSNRVHAVILASLLGILLAAAPAALAQTTWYVDDDAPNDPGPADPTISDPNEDGSAAHPFDAIQEAIFVSQDGDTVLVLDGTYTGLFNKDLDFGGLAITVRSENGPESCIIDCEGEGRGFQLRWGESQDSVIEGFHITQGNAPSDPFPVGGGIRCTQSSPTIKNCWISSCVAAAGGGIDCYASSAQIVSCLIDQCACNAANDGAAIRIGGNSADTVAILATVVEAQTGGPYAVSISGSVNVFIERSTIRET